MKIDLNASSFLTITTENGVTTYENTVTTHERTMYGDFSYSKTTPKEPIEAFYMVLGKAKKRLIDDLKFIIDTLDKKTLNSIWGMSSHSANTALGYAIDNENLETVEYLLKKGANPNIKVKLHQMHILENIIILPLTEKRQKIIELILPKLKVDSISINLNYLRTYYTPKHLILLINSTQISDEALKEFYAQAHTKTKKALISSCPRIQELVIEFNEMNLLDDQLKSIFFIA